MKALIFIFVTMTMLYVLASLADHFFNDLPGEHFMKQLHSLAAKTCKLLVQYIKLNITFIASEIYGYLKKKIYGNLNLKEKL